METVMQSSIGQRSAPLHVAGAGLALGTLVIGVAMIALGFQGHISTARHVAETAIGVVACGGALMLLRSALRGEQSIKAAGPLGDLAVLCAFLYLGTTMPAFGQHLVGRSTAQFQFAIVLVGMVIGTAVMALNPPPAGNVPLRQRLAPTFLGTDGVVLVVGTILLWIGLGQLDKAILTPPKWNWISFWGLAATGMLLLIVVRGAAKRLSPSIESHRWRTAGIWIVMGWELLLVAGLALMLYGALNNLTLGKNGFETGLKGNTAGLLLAGGAAVLLVFVRGPFEHALIRLRSRPRYPAMYPVAREALYVIGVTLFFFGGRAVLMGKNPTLVIGHPFPAAILILLGAIFLLVPVRLATKPDELRRSARADVSAKER